MASTLRLSYFHGSREDIETLNKIGGINVLLTADDDRMSYYLTDEQNQYIDMNDQMMDDLMTFVSTEYRLDKLSKAGCFYNFIKTAYDPKQNGIQAVFTHEWLLDRNMFEKIELFYRLAKKYKYLFCLNIL